jgi:hypothetical protein
MKIKQVLIMLGLIPVTMFFAWIFGAGTSTVLSDIFPPTQAKEVKYPNPPPPVRPKCEVDITDLVKNTPRKAVDIELNTDGEIWVTTEDGAIFWGKQVDEHHVDWKQVNFP